MDTDLFLTEWMARWSFRALFEPNFFPQYSQPNAFCSRWIGKSQWIRIRILTNSNKWLKKGTRRDANLMVKSVMWRQKSFIVENFWAQFALECFLFLKEQEIRLKCFVGKMNDLGLIGFTRFFRWTPRLTWVRRCSFRPDFVPKRFPHCSHANFFS